MKVRHLFTLELDSVTDQILEYLDQLALICHNVRQGVIVGDYSPTLFYGDLELK
jgi:hypothetical protein